MGPPRWDWNVQPKSATKSSQYAFHVIPLHALFFLGELQEPSKKVVSKAIEAQDIMVENAKNGTVDADGHPIQQHR